MVVVWFVLFLGHRDAPETIEPFLKDLLIDLIENKNGKVFYVGNNGNFDAMVYRQLKQLKEHYDFKYFVVSPYIISEKNKYYENLIVADSCETVPKKFAVVHRNRWMLRQSDTVITFVRYPSSGAARFQQLAIKYGKTVMKL